LRTDHYFDNPSPSRDHGFESRGASWYLSQAAQAFRANNFTSAALHLGCFAHGLEDRSSPIHSFGGFGARRSAVEQRLNTTAICQHHIGSPICDLIFWGADDHADVYGVPGYVPLALGADAASAGVAVGARMEEQAAHSREVIERPGGYADSHIQDPEWVSPAPPFESWPGRCTLSNPAPVLVAVAALRQSHIQPDRRSPRRDGAAVDAARRRRHLHRLAALQDTQRLFRRCRDFGHFDCRSACG